MKKLSENQIIIFLTLALTFIWGGYYLSPVSAKSSTIIQQQEQKKNLSKQQKTSNYKRRYFAGLNLQTSSYVVYDIETGEILTSQNENQPRPLASITKVMTVLVANDKLSPQTEITINNGDVNLRAGEHWQLANLASLTLVGSSNEGAQSIADALPAGDLVVQMNQKAQGLGLASMSFTNPTGLDSDAEIGGRGSALSVAKLFAHIIKTQPDLLSVTREPAISEISLDNFNHTIINTNEIVSQIPGLLASKTGFTDQAGGNLAVVANLGLRRPVAFVVLGSSAEGRFTDMKKLISATTDYFIAINK